MSLASAVKRLVKHDEPTIQPTPADLYEHGTQSAGAYAFCGGDPADKHAPRCVWMSVVRASEAEDEKDDPVKTPDPVMPPKPEPKPEPVETPKPEPPAKPPAPPEPAPKMEPFHGPITTPNPVDETKPSTSFFSR